MRRGKAREHKEPLIISSHNYGPARFITNMSLIKLQILYIPLSSSGFNLTKYLGHHWSLHFEIYSYVATRNNNQELKIMMKNFILWFNFTAFS